MKRLVFAVAALAAALSACGAPPTVAIDLRRSNQVPPLAGLARLRMIVRVCGQSELALAQNLPLDGSGDPLEASVTPGDLFYVWLQGWEECVGPCVPDSADAMNQQACVCIEDGQTPMNQIFRYEACSDWARAEEDALIPLTLAPVNPDQRLCPPAPMTSCGS